MFYLFCKIHLHFFKYGGSCKVTFSKGFENIDRYIHLSEGGNAYSHFLSDRSRVRKGL